MIDHCGIPAAEDRFDEIVTFYIAILAPLGYKKIYEYPGHAVGFGEDKAAAFWIGKAKEGSEGRRHFAFVAKDKATVDKFHEVAVEAGAKDNGQPGPRFGFPKEYHAAFVLDPLGNNIEAAYRDP